MRLQQGQAPHGEASLCLAAFPSGLPHLGPWPGLKPDLQLTLLLSSHTLFFLDCDLLAENKDRDGICPSSFFRGGVLGSEQALFFLLTFPQKCHVPLLPLQKPLPLFPRPFLSSPFSLISKPDFKSYLPRKPSHHSGCLVPFLEHLLMNFPVGLWGPESRNPGPHIVDHVGRNVVSALGHAASGVKLVLLSLLSSVPRFLKGLTCHNYLETLF